MQKKQNMRAKEKRTAKEDDRSITSKSEIEVKSELWVREDPWMRKREHLQSHFSTVGRFPDLIEHISFLLCSHLSNNTSAFCGKCHSASSMPLKRDTHSVRDIKFQSSFLLEMKHEHLVLKSVWRIPSEWTITEANLVAGHKTQSHEISSSL